MRFAWWLCGSLLSHRQTFPRTRAPSSQNPAQRDSLRIRTPCFRPGAGRGCSSLPREEIQAFRVLPLSSFREQSWEPPLCFLCLISARKSHWKFPELPAGFGSSSEAASLELPSQATQATHITPFSALNSNRMAFCGQGPCICPFPRL